MIVWGNIDETAKILLQKLLTFMLLLRYIPKHSQFIAASLMVRWSIIHETLTTSFKLLKSANVLFFFLLIYEALIFHCFFSDNFLMLLWVNTDETTMIWMQTLSIFYVFNVLVSEKLMFHCCFIDDFLVRFWWKMEISMQHYWLVKILMC